MIDLGIFLLCAIAVLLVIGFTLCCTPGFFKPSQRRYKRPYGLHPGKPVDDATLRRLDAQARETFAKERRRGFKCVK